MSTLTVEIQARVSDTLKKLGATQAQIDAVNDTLKQTAPSAKAATAAMNDLGTASAKAGAAAKGSSQKFFQAGQAISDFSVAGIRGAANNLEFLALQLGVSGPLLLAISAATSALVVFGDDILRALDPVGTKVKELRAGLEDVLDVVETGGVNLFLFEDQIPGALAEAEAAVKSINAEIQDLIGANQGTPELAYLNRDKIRAAQGELAKAEALIDRIQAKRDEYAQRDAAAGASRTLTAVAQNEELAKALRADFERAGLAEQLARISNDQLVTITREGKLRELLLQLQEKAAKATRDEVTDLDRAKKAYDDLAAYVERLNTGALNELDTLKLKTAELQAQARELEKQRKAAEDLARLQPFAKIQRLGAAGVQQDGATLNDLIEGINNRKQAPQLSARGLPDGVAEDAANQAAESQRALQAEFMTTLSLADQLAAEINYGLSDSLITLADSFGAALTSSEGFKGVGDTVLLTMADLAGNVGRIAIGTGVAIEGIKKALQTLNPFVAIGAGVALVALSAAVKSKLGAAAGGGGASYSGGGGAGSPLNGASQERLDALGFERLPNGAIVSAPSFQPTAPAGPDAYRPLPPASAQPLVIEGELMGEGETLRAIVRNTDKRVQATRGTLN